MLRGGLHVKQLRLPHSSWFCKVPGLYKNAKGGAASSVELACLSSLHIFCFFQRPCLNKIALAAAMELSAIAMEKKTPFERMCREIASQ